MFHESAEFECDVWQGVAVITRKDNNKCGALSLKRNGRNITSSAINSDCKKYGADKALRTYARLVSDWQ